MFPDIGGSELIIVAIVALLVVKPKDLPMMMRKFGEIMGKARRMANDFRASFEDMARQSELDELRKEVEAMRSKAADPVGLKTILQDTGAEIRAGLDMPTEPDYAFNYSPGDEVDNSIPWEGSEATASPSTPETVAEPAPAKKAAPKKKAAAKTSATGAKAPSTKAVKTAEPKSAPPAKRVAAKPSTKRAT